MKSFKRIGPVSLLILLLVFSYSAFMLSSVKVSAQTSSVDQVISLKSGFNFVSFTVAPPVTPAELISKNSNIEDIYLYNASAGSFLSVSEGTLTSLAVGKGYIIKSKADTSITINGPPASTIGDISLKKGFNLLGFSKLQASGAVNAFTKLMNASSAIEGIYKWSPVAGSFIQVVRDYEGNITMLDGSDPSLKPGEAYFVKVSEDTKVNYDDADVKLTKFFAGLYTDPNSDTVAASGTYDLNKVKVYAVYSDGSTVEVTAGAVFAPNIGTLTGKIYSAPKYATTAVFTVSYTDAASGVKREGYFTLAVTSSGATPVKTTSYRCTYKLAPNAKVIDEETVVTSSVTATQVVLNIPGSSDAPKSGDVIIGYYGDGYLRKVTAVSVQGSQAFVTTAKANMEDAFEALDYAYRGKLSTLHATSTAAAGSVESLAIGKFLRSRSVMPAPEPDRSIISKDKLKKILDHASLSITLTRAEISFDPILEYDIQIGWFKLKKFRFVVGGNLVCGIEFQIDATVATDLPLKSELEIFHSKPYVFGIGPVPCSFEWDINCGVDASASVTGSYKYSNEWTFAVRVGAEYDGGVWTKLNDIKRTSSASDDYELKGAVEIKPYLNVGFALKVCGLAGPKLYLEVFLSYLAEMASLNKVDIIVSAGVGAQTSFILELYSWTLAEFKTELFSFSWELYKRSIDFYVSAPVISPAGGSFSEDQTVTITCETQDAQIRYTIDGSEPSPTVGLVYFSPVKVSKSMTIKAIAFKSVNRYSQVTSADFAIRDILIPATPDTVFEFSEKWVCAKHFLDYCNECEEKEAFARAYVKEYDYVRNEPTPNAVSVPATCNINGKTLDVIWVDMVGNKLVEAIKVPSGVKYAMLMDNLVLKKVIMPPSIENFSFCSGSPSAGCPALYDLSFSWPSSLTELNATHFKNCKSLLSLELPSGLKKIGQNAFQGAGMVKLVIPESVESIDQYAFENMPKLEEVILSANITVIPERAFFFCKSLAKINLENIVEFKNGAFDGCDNLKKVTFGTGLKSITGRFGGSLIDPPYEFYFPGDAPEPLGNLPYDSKIYYKASRQGWPELIKRLEGYALTFIQY
jgi:hypothetical protein